MQTAVGSDTKRRHWLRCASFLHTEAALTTQVKGSFSIHSLSLAQSCDEDEENVFVQAGNTACCESAVCVIIGTASLLSFVLTIVTQL